MEFPKVSSSLMEAVMPLSGKRNDFKVLDISDDSPGKRFHFLFPLFASSPCDIEMSNICKVFIIYIYIIYTYMYATRTQQYNHQTAELILPVDRI